MYVTVRSVGSNEPDTRLDITPWRVFKWLPDSSAIYYQERLAGSNPQMNIYRIDPAKGQPKLLYTSDPDEMIDMTFSKKGDRVAVVRGKPITDAVILSAADASEK